MNTQYAERHQHVLNRATRCFRLGASPSTVESITGLGGDELIALYYDPTDPPKPGRRPCSAEWFYRANLIVAVQASLFYAQYAFLRSRNHLPPDSLVTAYEFYLAHFHDKVRMTFDRAYDLVRHTEGIWTACKPEIKLRLAVCGNCNSEYLAPVGTLDGNRSGCPFCKLKRRHNEDSRLRVGLFKGSQPPRRAEYGGSQCRLRRRAPCSCRPCCRSSTQDPDMENADS